jgi:hypothetical protein
MKAGMNGTDAVCRYWIRSGPRDGASGDAPCEWFVAHRLDKLAELPAAVERGRR